MNSAVYNKMTNRAPIYIYATEMVSSYYNILGIRNKRVLSIVGSGDQIINAYYYGAKEVVGFDINKYSAHILDLKVNAINNLTRKEYLQFFGRFMASGSFDYDIYCTLKSQVSLETRRFFNKIYKEFNYDGQKIIKSSYFRQRSMIEAGAEDINDYLTSDRKYFKCKEILHSKKINFLTFDINDILKNEELKGKFDVINLSNVLNYLTANIEEKMILNTLIKVTKDVSKKLNNKGIFFYYSYTPKIYHLEQRKIPPASRVTMIENIVKHNNFRLTIKRFKGIYNKTFDRINIFHKI